MDRNTLRASVEESIATKTRLMSDCLDDIEALQQAAIQCLSRGGKLMLCGNGGSACDAAHAAGELVGWFEKKDRAGYAALALGQDVPTLTAIGNDAGYEHVFSRQVVALGKPDDLLIGISTSGGSKNVALAMEEARRMGIATAALTGSKGGKVADLADVAVKVPSDNTARIQECHLLCVHVLCAAVEAAIEPGA